MSKENSAHDTHNCCSYCGEKLPIDFFQKATEKNDPIVCEKCGTEIIKENDIQLDSDSKEKKNFSFSHLYEIISNRKSPIDKILCDSDFPLIFTENYIIVTSRIIYFQFLEMEKNLVFIFHSGELTKEIIELLYKKLKPITSKRIENEFLQNLNKISIKGFEKGLKLQQSKLEVSERYYHDLAFFLKWLIKKVFIIISELWNEKELPKFDRIIRDDLKSFNLRMSYINGSQKNFEFFQAIRDKTGNLGQTDILNYSTLDYIDDLIEGVSKLVSPDELWRGILTYDKFSGYIGMHKRYIRDTRHRIMNSNSTKYNPDFKFSREQLGYFFISLLSKLGEVDMRRIVEITFHYINNNNILEYQNQQWQLHNPDLKYNFFRKMDNTLSGYYFGLLLADGMTDAGKNIGLFLEKEDKKVVERFKEDLHISNKLEYVIDERIRKLSGDFPERYGIRVGCKPMMDDLRELGFFDFKNGNALPKGFFTKLERKVALSILLGFYDGDGEEGAPIIHNTNKAFLEQIKREFNLIYSVKLRKSAKKGEIIRGQLSNTKASWYLRIGPELFNEMIESHNPSMERKRKYYPLKSGRYAYNSLVEKINTKELLEELLLIGPRIHLAKAFGVSFDLFKRLCDENNVQSLPHSYWKRSEKKKWKSNFERKIKVFKQKYNIIKK